MATARSCGHRVDDEDLDFRCEDEQGETNESCPVLVERAATYIEMARRYGRGHCPYTPSEMDEMFADLELMRAEFHVL